MNSPADVWNRALKLLSKELTATSMNTWFEESQAVEMTDEIFVISVPTDLQRDVILRRYMELVSAALYEIFSYDIRVVVLGPEDLARYEKRRFSKDALPLGNSVFTFENFVVGNSNRFAAAAAKAVADKPAESYNPLFIYGESGLGKTHLLNAIAHEIRSRHPDFRIVYTKGDDFTNELVAAIRDGTNVQFREKYRYADLFLVDDIQFIAGKKQTQEEFFHTFNSLHEAGKQIVLTADRPPMEMTLLEDRLRTRFEWGLLADIQPPDFETRMAIIKKKAAQYGFPIPEDICEYIASNITSNVRQLEGIVKRMIAMTTLANMEVTVENMNRLLKGIFKEKAEFLPTAQVIIEEVAKYYQQEEEDIRGKKRNQEFTQTRQIAMYLIRSITSAPLTEIGREFSGRDHTTVLSSIRRVEEKAKTNAALKEALKDIRANIYARS